MNKNMFKNIALVLLLGIAIFSMLRYVVELKEKRILQDNLAQAQDQVSALAQIKQNLMQEKQNLLQELRKEKELKGQLEQKNKSLKGHLKASKNRIARLLHENTVTRNNLEMVNAKFSILKAENSALIDGRRRVYLENKQLKSKWNSLPELKKAMQELKAKEYKTFDLIVEGNQGFLIKDGRSTALEKVKIEVIPAQAKE